jgi:cell division protein ZipA
MWELRWILLALGAVVVVGVYLWSTGVLQRRVSSARSGPEPAGLDNDPDIQATPRSESPAGASGSVARKPSRSAPERIIALRLIPRVEELDSARAVASLATAGLEHGRYGIFHRQATTYGGEPVFSVASLTEPGSFDLQNLEGTTIAGLSFFMVLPGVGDPVARFDAMVETARALAVDLESELHDERGSSWSVQRERYVREELIEYRHQSERR